MCSSLFQLQNSFKLMRQNQEFYFTFDLVCTGCSNKNHRLGTETTDTSLSQFWRQGSPRSRYQQIPFLVRAPRMGLVPLLDKEEPPERREEALISTVSLPLLFPEDFFNFIFPLATESFISTIIFNC